MFSFSPPSRYIIKNFTRLLFAISAFLLFTAFSPLLFSLKIQQLTILENHLERYMGDIHEVFYEDPSAKLNLNIYWMIPGKSDEGENYHYLATAGMSSKAMKIKNPYYKHAELVFVLPPDWFEQEERRGEDETWWPYYLLRSLAYYPHENRTWLGEGHTISLHEDYENVSGFSAVMLYRCQSSQSGFHVLKQKNKVTNFYCLYPLYAEELKYKLKHGAEPLLKLLHENGVSDLLKFRRPNTFLD